MPRLRTGRPVDPRVHDWLVENAGGWSAYDSGPERPGRLDFDAANLGAVREAVLARLGVTGAELRAACSAGTRTLSRRKVSIYVAIPPEALAHAGVGPGDSVQFDLLPGGRIALGRAAEVDVKAVRARIRAAGVSARLLARLFYVPKSTVHRIVKGGAS
jgi:hypothetical protein